MGARWYDAVVGRFIKKEPSLFGGGFNLYAYAGNDPVNFFDPDGAEAEAISNAWNQLWNWLNALPPALKWPAMVAGANAAVPYAATYGVCVAGGLLTAGDEPIPDSGIRPKTDTCVAGAGCKGPAGPKSKGICRLERELESLTSGKRYCQYVCDQDGTKPIVPVPSWAPCPPEIGFGTG